MSLKHNISITTVVCIVLTVTNSIGGTALGMTPKEERRASKSRVIQERSCSGKEVETHEVSDVKDTQYSQDIVELGKRIKAKAVEYDSADTNSSTVKDNIVLPVIVKPVSDVKRNTVVLDPWARDAKVSHRRSSREALKPKKENDFKLVRDQSFTSNFRYDVDKAAYVRRQRNKRSKGAVKEQVRRGRNKVSYKELNERDNQESVNEKENTRTNDMMAPSRYRCDYASTDWPCHSCVAKRRAHCSISVCTIIVTIIAMIVGASIIAGASSSPDAVNGNTNP